MVSYSPSFALTKAKQRATLRCGVYLEAHCTGHEKSQKLFKTTARLYPKKAKNRFNLGF